MDAESTLVTAAEEFIGKRTHYQSHTWLAAGGGGTRLCSVIAAGRNSQAEQGHEKQERTLVHFDFD